MTTWRFVLAISFVTSLNALVKQWETYNLPQPLSGGMSSYNATNGKITILNGDCNWCYGTWNAGVYMDYSINVTNFTIHHWPAVGGVDSILPVTNSYISIEDLIYFVSVGGPECMINAFSTSTGTFVRHDFFLEEDYMDPPCLAKSNDNKYLFILGGESGLNGGTSMNTLGVYDIAKMTFKKQWTLPFPASHIGCIVASNDFLYIIGGAHIEYRTNIAYKNEIWGIYVAYVDDIGSGVSDWMFGDTLPYYPQHPFIAELNSRIYIMGGWDPVNLKCSDETNSFPVWVNGIWVEVSPGPLLPNPLCYTIWLFGGQTSMPLTWMKSSYISVAPTISPSQSPTYLPSQNPTASPTTSPTKSPSHVPSKSPSRSPVKHPTNSPSSHNATESPTHSPVHFPTSQPTDQERDNSSVSSILYVVIGAAAVLTIVILYCLLKTWIKRLCNGQQPLFN
eukprot:182275_1